MDKNVSGVDLEELLKAREELNNERGVETDPNMYSDYNPNREEQTNETQEVSTDNSYENITENSDNVSSAEILDEISKLEENLSETEKPAETLNEDGYKNSLNEEPEEPANSQTAENLTGGSEENLSKFSAFSAFEVKENAHETSSVETVAQPSLNSEESKPIETTEEIKPLETESTEENKDNDAELDKKLEAIDNASELEDLLNSLLADEDDEEEQTNSETSAEEEQTNAVENNEEQASPETNISEAEEEQTSTGVNAIEVDIEPKFDNVEITSNETEETDVNSGEDATENVAEETNVSASENAEVSETAEISESAETKEPEKTQEDNLDFSLDKVVDTLSESNEEKSEAETQVNEEILNLNELNEDESKIQKEVATENEQTASEEPKKQEENSSETEIITDYSKLTEILQKQLKETEEEAEEKIEESDEKYAKYAKIEDFKFINEITSDEFKKADKFSYILGKDENNELVFGNFKEHFNLAVFGKNDGIVSQFLNTMILSLCLKNSYHDINFVLLDSDINSTFEVYNKSSYLYFNRIAKTNKEILDTLIEVSKEVDNRYEKLASLGVKNIENYNDIAVENAITPMPYILLVFNNYTSASEATYNDKINACLYQILKFGRIAGIYAVVTAKLPIEINQVNYNLSSRLSFKSDEDSRFTVGAKGAEELPNEDDALYFNISSNSLTHIKTATLSSTELDLIIKDLEE